MKKTFLKVTGLTGLICLQFALSTNSYADTAVMNDVQPQFSATTGEALYNSICISCHMAGGTGAIGAARFPALAKNPKLAAPEFVAHVVLYGQKGMPGFGGALNNQQITELVNYVGTHFGNAVKTSISSAQIANLRKANYQYDFK